MFRFFFFFNSGIYYVLLRPRCANGGSDSRRFASANMLMKLWILILRLFTFFSLSRFVILRVEDWYFVNSYDRGKTGSEWKLEEWENFYECRMIRGWLCIMYGLRVPGRNSYNLCLFRSSASENLYVFDMWNYSHLIHEPSRIRLIFAEIHPERRILY